MEWEIKSESMHRMRIQNGINRKFYSKDNSISETNNKCSTEYCSEFAFKKSFCEQKTLFHRKWSELDFSLNRHFLSKNLWTICWLNEVFRQKFAIFWPDFLPKKIKKSTVKIPWKLLFWWKMHVQANRAEKSVKLRFKKILMKWKCSKKCRSLNDKSHSLKWQLIWRANSSFSHKNGPKTRDGSNVRQENKFERLNVVR